MLNIELILCNTHFALLLFMPVAEISIDGLSVLALLEPTEAAAPIEDKSSSFGASFFSSCLAFGMFADFVGAGNARPLEVTQQEPAFAVVVVVVVVCCRWRT